MRVSSKLVGASEIVASSIGSAWKRDWTKSSGMAAISSPRSSCARSARTTSSWNAVAPSSSVAGGGAALAGAGAAGGASRMARSSPARASIVRCSASAWPRASLRRLSSSSTRAILVLSVRWSRQEEHRSGRPRQPSDPVTRAASAARLRRSCPRHGALPFAQCAFAALSSPRVPRRVARHVTKRLYSETIVTESRYDACRRQTTVRQFPRPCPARPAAGSCSCTSCRPRRRTCGCGRGGGCSSSGRFPSSRRSTCCPTPRPRARTSSGSRPRSRPRAATPRCSRPTASMRGRMMRWSRSSGGLDRTPICRSPRRSSASSSGSTPRGGHAARGSRPWAAWSRAFACGSPPSSGSTSSAAPAATAWPPCSAHSRTRRTATPRQQPARPSPATSRPTPDACG